MFFKKSLKFLDNARKKALFSCESRLVYMSPRGPETSRGNAEAKESGKDIPKQNKAAIKKLKEELQKGEQYKKDFEIYIGKHEYVKKYDKKLTRNDAADSGIVMIQMIAKSLPKKIRESQNAVAFAQALAKDISISTERNLDAINRNIPISMQLGPGSALEFYNDEKGFSIQLDLKLDSPRLGLIQQQIEELKKPRERKERRREQVRIATNGKLDIMRKGVKPQNNFDQLVAKSKSKYLKKQGDVYVVDFKGKNGRIDRKAEHDTHIQDLFDLSRLKGGNMYIRIYVDGVSPAGVKHKYWAYYHPSQGTFIQEGTTKRALIFHGTRISKIEYKVAKPKVAARPKVVTQRKRAPQVSEKQRVENRKLGILQKNWDNVYGNDAYIFQNKRFSVPKFIQDDSDFEKNWGRIDATLEAALTGEPFNLKTTEARRKYIQDVIQKDLNSRIYAEDFFKYKLNGKDLYKGGYKKFIKDFHSVDRKIAELGMDVENPQNAEEKKLAKKWGKLEPIAFGIGRIFDALSRLSLHAKQPETSTDIYRKQFLGVQKLNAKEKANLQGVQYHSLESLLHKRENAPSKGFDIGITNAQLKEIKGQVIEQEAPDLNVRQLLKAKGGLKLMFMAFGLDNLIKRGCIKKLDDTHYIVVKIPTRGWGEALGVLSQNKAKLYDDSAENFKKWEAVRASLDQGRQARNFILRIFKPSGSTVRQNINWWKKLWHLDFKNKKKITMAYLGKVTLDPSALEKHVATDRGYLDMMEKCSKRVEGTSIYEPKKAEVLRLSNSYLENALLATFMNAKTNDITRVTNQLLREFNIEGKVNLQKPLDKRENRIANMKEIYKAISLKGLDPANLTKAHIRMIRMGYVLGRQVETAQNWNEVMSKNLSNKPLYRAIQLKALRDGAPIYKLKEIEQRIHLAIFGLSQSMHAPGVHKFNVRGAGAAASIDLGEWAGQKWHFSVGAAGADGKFIPFAELGAAIKLGKKVKLKWRLGATIGFVGASAAVEFPVTSEWDMYIEAGAGITLKGAQAGVGAAIGARWNKRRAERLRETRALNERGVKAIDAAITAGDVDKAAELILKNPTFGEYIKAIKYKFRNPKNPNGLPNAVLVDIYQNARTEWLNAARRGVKIPAVTGFGVGVFAGVSSNPLQTGLSVGAYVTFTIPGTTVNYVIRHEHPKYSEYVQSQVAQEALKRKLAKEGKGNSVISSYTLSANTGIVYFDSRLGRGHVARPNGISEMKRAIAVKDKEQSASIGRGTFESIRRTFADLDMEVKMVPNPKNPKQNLLAVTPLQTEGSNVEMLMDPELRSKGIILDKAHNRILLAASEARRLYVTRTKYRYPFARKGAMNLEVISFKNNPNRSNMEIREDSPRYIYKYKGEKYAMVRGEARTGLSEESANTMTLKQYKGRKAQYETFTNRKLEFGMQEGKNLTDRMSNAVGYSEQPPTRFNQLKLGSFADMVLKLNKRYFEKGVASADTPAKEAAWKMKFFAELKAEFKDYSKTELKNANLQLNDQELNLIYTYMLNQSFLALQHRSEAVINRRIEIRNKLFRAYMKKYVGEFAQRNPEQWKAIQAIDPSVTPDSIANYLMLTMPQNAKQFKDFLKRKGLPIGEGLKFASYTQKWKREAFGMSYGTQMPRQFADIFKMVNPTRLNLDSPNPRERAAARLIFQVMSPLSTRNLETVDGKKKFLESELSLLLITMYDEKSGVSPMIEVLGKKNYQGMIAIYKGLKEGRLAAAINANPQAFDQFKTLVMGIRAAQLNAEPTYVFKNKYIFHLKQTEVYSGAYLKCGNGTIAARQRIGLSVRREQVGHWKGARTAHNISVIPNERAAAADITVGWAHTFKSKQRPTKEPPEDRKPPKEDAPNRVAPGESQTTQTQTPTGPEATDSAY